MSTPVPEKQPIEVKVKAATLAATVAGAVIAALNNTTADNELLGAAPAWLQAAVLIIGPGAMTFVSGWVAKHTFRVDQGNRTTRTG